MTSRTDLLRSDRGSTLPLMIGFFLLAGLLLSGGVAASAAFLAQRELQSSCDGAAIAAAQSLQRADGSGPQALVFDAEAGQISATAYLQQAWGPDAGGVAVEVKVDLDEVILRCGRTAHVPFEAVFSPDGVNQTVTSSAKAPPLG